MREQQLFWKVLSIIFISLFVIESLFLIWIFKVGYDIIGQEDKCITICSINEYYRSYWYKNDLCYCITQEGEYILQGGNLNV